MAVTPARYDGPVRVTVTLGRHPNTTPRVVPNDQYARANRRFLSMEVHTQLGPLIRLLRNRRVQLGLTGIEAGALAGKASSWIAELESKSRLNPSVSRLATWCAALDTQEFGLYIVIDGNYTAIPISWTEDETDPADPSPAADLPL